MAKITKISARQILDSRGNPTVETTVALDSGATAVASCPSGASTGTYEAVELRDNDPNVYGGKGVLKAVENVNTTINVALAGKEASDLNTLDTHLIALDGTENKSKLGANAILSVSIALTKAISQSNNISTYQFLLQISQTPPTTLTIPKPLCNLINGGMHAGGNLDLQEFMVIPTKEQSFAKAIEQVVIIHNHLKKILIEKEFQPLVGDEGGFAPKLTTNQEALDLLQEATSQASQTDIAFGIDAAANSFFKNGMYSIRDMPEGVSSAELGNFYRDLIKKYSLLYLEDPFAEDDFVGWASFTPHAPAETIVTGDDLICTNPKRLSMALEKQMVRGIIIKPNQIGTVTETVGVVQKAKGAGLKIIVSHRSGETNDDFIADLAVGVGADFIKSGAPVRGERVAKYNRLLQIEQELLEVNR